MAQRFQCALYSEYGSTNVGRFFHRWLVEWLTRVVGWTLVDKAVGTKWDNVAASGSTCSSTSIRRLQITSPGYVFSSADVNGMLTLTGFSDPTKDGIYKIRDFIGVVGSVYTVDVWIDGGVHSDGIPPADSGITWRLWFANDTYCPTTSDVCVVGGTGTTGAGLTNGVGTGDSFSAVGTTVTLTDAAANFQASDVGKNITIAGATTPSHNGTFAIASRISATQITWTNGASPPTEAFPGTWAIRYIFHVHFQVNTWLYGFGSMRMSPFASWNSVSHSWNDSRYTSQATPTPPGAVATAQSTIAIWAEADSDHFFVALRTFNDGIWQLHAAGEMESFYPETDPNPCYVWAGQDSSNGYRYEGGDIGYGRPIIGYGTDSAYFSFPTGVKALGFDDLTTVTMYMVIPVSFSSADFNAVQGHRRKVSCRAGTQFYRIPIILESRTSGFMEMRGTFRKVWCCPTGLPMMYQQGASGEYISPLRGVLIPWNGGRNPMSDTGYVCAG
jgi:hypothetical protein